MENNLVHQTQAKKITGVLGLNLHHEAYWWGFAHTRRPLSGDKDLAPSSVFRCDQLTSWPDGESWSSPLPPLHGADIFHRLVLVEGKVFKYYATRKQWLIFLLGGKTKPNIQALVWYLTIYEATHETIVEIRTIILLRWRSLGQNAKNLRVFAGNLVTLHHTHTFQYSLGT